MPGIGRIVHWSANWESDCHGEVAVVGQRFEPKDSFELVDGLRVVGSDQSIKVVNNAVDTGYTILGSKSVRYK